MIQCKDGLFYVVVGVDIDVGNVLVEWIKFVVVVIKCFGVMDGLGGFGVLFDLCVVGFNDLVLVVVIDGVGIKLCIGIDMGELDGLGIDFVVMCVNDLVC